MKRRIVSILLAVIFILTLVPIVAQRSSEAAFLTNDEIITKMNALKQSYPSGKYWNHVSGDSYVAPHTYVAQVLKIVYYTPNYESASSDQMIIRDFNMADTIAYKASFDISTMGAYIAAANTVTKIRVTIYDKTSGKLEVSGEESNPSLTRINSGIYRIYKISGTLDRSVLFGNLSRGVKTIYFTVTSSTGRSRIVYTKDFTVS